MSNTTLAFVLSIIFTSITVLPNIMAMVDNTYDISVLIDSSEEEEKKGEEKGNDLEIEILEKNKALIPHKVSAQVKCSQCNQHYVFEEKILDSVESSGGTTPFPENGIYECDSCGHRMKLKDIQGQIRASIKDNLVKFINRTRNV